MSLLNESPKKDFITFNIIILLSAILWLMFPIFSLIALAVIPILLALLVYRQDSRYGLGSLMLIIIVLSLLTGQPHFALLLVLQTGPMGILVGLLFKNKVSWGKALATVIIFSMIGPVGMYLTDFFSTGNSPFELSEESLEIYRQGIKEIEQTLPAGIGRASGESLDTIGRQFEGALPILSMASAFIWFMFLSAFSFFITRGLIVRMGHNVPAAIPFRFWKLPWYSVWGVIASLAMMLIGEQLGLSGLVSLGKVLLWVNGFIFAIMGISVFTFFINLLKLHWAFKVFILIIMLIFLPNMMVVMAFIGVVDSVWNIRRFTSGTRKPEEDDIK